MPPTTDQTLASLNVPEVSETADGFFAVDGLGDAKYATKEEAERVAKNVAIAKRAKRAA